MTQAERLVRALRRRPMTYGEMEALRISTCPWRRLSEAGHRFLKLGERIERQAGEDGLLRLRVVKA